MTPPRLREGADHRARLLDAAAAVPPFDDRARARLRRQVLARLHPTRSRGLVLGLAFATSLCVGVVVTGAVLRARTPGEATTIELSAGAVSHRVPGGGLELSAGTARVKTSTPLPVLTPELEVVVRSGSVAVAVEQGRSEVDVFEGSTAVRRQGQQLSLNAGQRVSSDDPRLLAPLEVRAPPADEGACDLPCLERAAVGDDVRAQTALLRLALDALAAEHWARATELTQRSLTRFPSGVLEPEVHLVALEAARHERREGDARREASWYLEHASSSPQAPQVALVLGDLELHAARLAEAKRAYARALELTPSAAQAQEAHAGVGVVELRAGHAALARAAFERALAAAPDGPRAGELERRLSAP
jgi:hypothetical protein